jgi:hypothetical protein
MGHEPYPCFIDLEATGFGPESYPIEVAWSLPSGEIRRCLISPASVPGWTAWDPAAERVHGIDRDRLLRNGWPPDYVVERLESDLAGATVFSDAPDFDAAWLARLFAVVGRTMPFALEHIDELLLRSLRRPEEAIWQTLARIERMKAEIAAMSSGKHSAGYDVGYLLALWRRAIGEPVKMNHGIGPLPPVTATGTFKRLHVDRPGERKAER